MVMEKWTYDNPDNQKLRAQVGARYWTENRIGGQTSYDPDQQNITDAYGQNINIDQVDLYTKFNIKLADLTSIIWVSSGFGPQLR